MDRDHERGWGIAAGKKRSRRWTEIVPNVPERRERVAEIRWSCRSTDAVRWPTVRARTLSIARLRDFSPRIGHETDANPTMSRTFGTKRGFWTVVVGLLGQPELANQKTKATCVICKWLL